MHCKTLFLTFLFPSLLLAEPGPEELEARLAKTTGQERLVLLVELTRAYDESDPQRAIELGTEALEILESMKDHQRELELLNSLALAEIISGDYATALRLATRAEELARTVGDQSARALALQNAGRAYGSTSQFERALELFNEATLLSQKIGEKSPWGDALNNIGIVHWRMGDYPQALDHFIRARQAYEEAGDQHRVASALNNMGMVQRKLGQPEKALEFYRQTLEIRRQIGPDGATANVLNNIGNIYRDLSQPAQALEYFNESLSFEPKEMIGRSNTIMHIGDAYTDLGEYDRALESYGRATLIKQDIGDRGGMARVLVGTGKVQRQKGQYEAAIETLRRSLAIAEEIHTSDAARNAYFELSRAYAEADRFEEALAAFENYERIKSETFNEQNSQTIAEMEARFKADRNARAIEILEQKQAIDALELERQKTTRKVMVGAFALLLFILLQLSRAMFRRRQQRADQLHWQERERYITELEAKNAEIQDKNAEMERFTYTVSHDLKSPLVTIRGFLGLLKKDILAGDVDRLQDDIARIDSAAKKMALLLDDLLILSRIGRVFNETQEGPLRPLVEEAIELVAGSIAQRGVEVAIAPDLPVVSSDRPRLVEVLQNLIENSVKFMGDQTAPRIEIGTRQDGEEEVFFVRDNGIGVAPQYHRKIFDLFERLEHETDGTGVGLALVQRIINVHGGRIWVESEGEGKGSCFCFTLPQTAELARQST